MTTFSDKYMSSSIDAHSTREKSPTHIAVVIPCYQVEFQIGDVLRQVPSIVQTIVAVNDFSPDRTGEILDQIARTNQRLTVSHHEWNQGVGGATKTGYKEALRRGANVIVKLDGDGQMDPLYIEKLIGPILSGQAEYAKGNRFHDWSYVQSMPLIRKFGNLVISFLTKIASGYWHIFDPTNGYTAISNETLNKLDFDRLKNGYLFESSMLVELYRLRARMQQIPMKAVYGDEQSSLSVSKSLIEFPIYLIRATISRFVHRYIWQDFTAVSVFVIFGLINLLFGITFGAYHWIRSIKTMQPATTGTVMLSVVPLILGFQLLLQSIVLDIQNSPK